MASSVACGSVMRLFLLAVFVVACTGLHRERRTIGIVFRGLVDAATRTTPKPKDPRSEKLRQPPPPTVYLIPIQDKRAEAQLLQAAQAFRQNASRTYQPTATDKILENPAPIVESNHTEISRRNSTVPTEQKQFFIRIRGEEGKSIMIKITGDDVKVKKDSDSYMIGVNTQDTKSNIKIQLPDKNGNRFEHINPNYIPLHPNAIPNERTKLHKSKDSGEDQEAKEGYQLNHLNHLPFAIPFSAYPYNPYHSQPTFIPSPHPSVAAYPHIAAYPSVAAYPLQHPGFPYPQQPSKPEETPTKEPPKTHVQLTVRVKDETKNSDSHSKESQSSQETIKPQITHSQQQSESPSQGYSYDQPKSVNPVKYTGPNSIGYEDSHKYTQWYLQPPQSQSSSTASAQQSAQQNWNYAQYSPYSQYLQPPQPQTTAALQQTTYDQATQQPTYHQPTQQPAHQPPTQQPAYNQVNQQSAYNPATQPNAYNTAFQQSTYPQSGWNYAQYSPYAAYLQPQQQHTSASQHPGWNYAQYTPYPSYLQDTVAPPYLGYRFQRSLHTRDHDTREKNDCFLCSVFE